MPPVIAVSLTLSLVIAARLAAPPVLDEAEALRRLGEASSAAWIEDGVLFAVVRAEADAVQLLAAVQKPLDCLDAPGLWGGAFPLDRADEAAMSCGFAIQTGDTVERRHDTPPIRGPHARPAPKIADPLRGTVTTHVIESRSLGAARSLHVYLPPAVPAEAIRQVVFLADGQAAANYATVVEPLVVTGTIPPTAIVGVASDTSGGAGDPANDFRAMEYLKGFDELVDGADPERFDRHWRLFTEEVPAWVESELGLSVPCSDRIVAGTSNGGAFAAAVAALAPDRFGASIVMSSGWLMAPDLFTPPPPDTVHAAFFSAGVYEPRFLEQTRRAYESAGRAGYVVALDERIGGHDPLIWREQLAAGLRWIHASRAAPADAE